ncbi:MAG: zinc ribbon domain-containing protein [Chloroflexi bacterium]|nr:zinc ribbon domain-containing protein [Chloroflexota bacterium]
MPLYEYRCQDCQATFDLLRPFSRADEPADCPNCHSNDSKRAMSRCAALSRGADGSTSSVGGGGGCAGFSASSCASCGH